MWLIRAALRRPITVLVAVLAVALTAALRREPDAGRHLPGPRSAGDLRRPAYGGMDPAQMEGFLTYYYEYHFLYITGIEHVESKSIQNAALMKLTFHPGTDMAEAMARDHRLRQPRARLHAAGHGRPVHHALRRRQRAGGLPGVLERHPQPRRDPGPGAQPGAAAVRDAARAVLARRRSAAASAPSSSASIPIGCAPTTCRPTR